MPLKLFGHDTSPYVRRIRILMDELDVPFERDSHGWLDATEEFKAASPIQRLPMLDRGPSAKTQYVYDSKVIADVVCRDVATLRAPRTKPRAGVQQTLWRAELEERDTNVFTVLDGGLDAAINGFCIEQAGTARATNGYLQRQFTRAEECFAWLDKSYAAGPTLTPGELAFVDIAVSNAITWIRFRKVFDVSTWPNLVAMHEAHEKRPSFVATNPYSS